MKIRLAAGPTSLSSVANAVQGTFAGPDTTVSYICTDSREADADTLFLALPGEHVDGHEYIHAALEQGCRAACVTHPVKESLAQIIVPSVSTALMTMGARARDSFSGQVVAVTGSVGKTTTKDYIAGALNALGPTQKTVANHNSLLGLPMSLLSQDADRAFHVVEMGMNHAGEIAAMTKAARPHVAVITNVGTSHIGILGSRRAIADAKLEIIGGMTQDDVLVINGDEPLLAGAGGFPGRIVRVSVADRSADVFVSAVLATADGTKVSVWIDGQPFAEVRVPNFGVPALWAVGYAAAVSFLFGGDAVSLQSGLQTVGGESMRQNVTQTDGVTWIADCYNASPESTVAALDVLKIFPGRHIAVLGDMLELGAEAPRLHSEVGAAAAKICDCIVFYGELSRFAFEAARQSETSVRVLWFPEADMAQLQKTLASEIRAGDVVLVKGSRGMQMERILPR